MCGLSTLDRGCWAAKSPSFHRNEAQLPDICEIEIEVIGVQRSDRGHLHNQFTKPTSIRHKPVKGLYDPNSADNTIDQKWLRERTGEKFLGGSNSEILLIWKFRGLQGRHETLHRIVDTEGRFKGSIVTLFNHNRSDNALVAGLSPFERRLQKALGVQGGATFSKKRKRQWKSFWKSLIPGTKDHDLGRNDWKWKTKAPSAEPNQDSSVRRFGQRAGELGGPGPSSRTTNPRTHSDNLEASQNRYNTPLPGVGDLNIIRRSSLVPRQDTLAGEGGDSPNQLVGNGEHDRSQKETNPTVDTVTHDESPHRNQADSTLEFNFKTRPTVTVRPPTHDEHLPAPNGALSELHLHTLPKPQSSAARPVRGHAQTPSQGSSGITNLSSPSSRTRQTTTGSSTQDGSTATAATSTGQLTIGRRGHDIDTSELPVSSHYPTRSTPEDREDRFEERSESDTDRISRCSSSDSDRPWPDDYWTYDEEQENYFHIEANDDGTTKRVWYPREFS